MKRQYTLAELVRWKGKAAPEVVEAVVEVLRELDRTRAERDHFRAAWATAEWTLVCGVDAAEAVRQERMDVAAYLRGLADDYGVCLDLSLADQADKIERGEHSREKEGT
jgi:hypothetical protein